MNRFEFDAHALAKPIMTEIASYNWEIWREIDGTDSMWKRYLDKIDAYCKYLRLIGIKTSTKHDRDNGLITDLEIGGENFKFDFTTARQRYLDQYHPGQKVYTAPSKPDKKVDFDVDPWFELQDDDK